MKCPGQDMQYWNADAIFMVDCPKCGKQVEFYKDDTTRKCHHCEHRFVNPKMDFGCAAYCQFAEQCIGTLPEEFTGSKDGLLKDKIAVEVKRYHKSDFRRIGHVTRVAHYAETLGKLEKAQIPTLLCAAFLSDVAEIEGDSMENDFPFISELLKHVGANEDFIDQVLLLLSQDNREGKENQILHEARLLAFLEAELRNAPQRSHDELLTQFTRHTTSESAKEIARAMIS